MDLVNRKRRSLSPPRFRDGWWDPPGEDEGQGKQRHRSPSPGAESSFWGSDVVHFRKRRAGGGKRDRGGGAGGGDGRGGKGAEGEHAVWAAFRWYVEKTLYPPLRRVWPGRLG